MQRKEKETKDQKELKRPKEPRSPSSEWTKEAEERSCIPWHKEWMLKYM